MSEKRYYGGALLSPPDSRDHIAGAAPARALPTDIRARVIPKYRKNQGAVNSCVAHVLAEWLECQIRLKTGLWYSLSPGFIYGNREGMEHTGQGMVVREALGALRHGGDMRKQEFDAAEFEMPQIAGLVEAYKTWLSPRGKPQAIKEYIRLDETDRDALKTALLNYEYIVAAIPVYADTALDKWNILRHKSTLRTDYHCVLIYGCNRDGWLFVNSWGHAWGNNGCAVLPFDYGISEAWSLLPGEELAEWYSDAADRNRPSLPPCISFDGEEPCSPFEGEGDAVPEPSPEPEPEPVPPPPEGFAPMEGIDVSAWQREIDWDRVAASGIRFAMLRAGITLNAGGVREDEFFRANVKGAQAAGIPIGVYVYSYDRSVEAAEKSAKALLELIRPFKLEYPVAFDMEYEPWNKTMGRGKLNTDIAVRFMDTIEAAGYYSTLYCSAAFIPGYMEPSRLVKYDKWIADWTPPCDYADPGIWQHFNKGSVTGISGRVDLDTAYKDYPAVIRRAGLNHLEEETPEPEPEPVVEEWKVETGPFGADAKTATSPKAVSLRAIYLLCGYEARICETAAGDALKVQVAGLEKDKAKALADAVQVLTGWQTNAYRVV